MKGFTLTPTERRVLALIEQGLGSGEITKILGYNSGAVVGKAVEKGRLISLQSKGAKKKSGFSSLSKAHGEIRMKGTK